MRARATPPSLAAINDRHLLRVGAAAAATGAAAQLVASVLEPDWGGDPAKAVRVVANNGFWSGDRLLDPIGVLLAVCALTTVGRTFNPCVTARHSPLGSCSANRASGPDPQTTARHKLDLRVDVTKLALNIANGCVGCSLSLSQPHHLL